MQKVSLPPETILYPLPVVLLTAVAGGGGANIITLAWAGVINSVPPMVSVSIRPSRHSHDLVARSGQFTLNLPTAAMLEAVDYCGTVSGKNVDKFRATGLTQLPGETVGAPLIAECPVGLECAVRQSLHLGSHTMFLAEVLKVRADAAVAAGARLNLSDVEPLAYYPGASEYHRGGPPVARYGFTGGTLKGSR